MATKINKEIIDLMPPAVDSGGTVVLVSQDGIQRPPLRFPKGGHLLQFLSCLENGLLPHGQLDPPLWSQRGKVSGGGQIQMLYQPYPINKSMKKTYRLEEQMRCLVTNVRLNVLLAPHHLPVLMNGCFRAAGYSTVSPAPTG